VVNRIGSALALAGLLAVIGTARANDAGTAAEARAMLERAIAALKDDQAAALASFTAGAPGFKAKDLYVFCVTPAGVVTANGGHPEHIGLDTHSEIDTTGKNIGATILAAAKAGEIHTATYMYPKPGSDQVALKNALISRVKDQICGVGYYAE
jgi:Single Cache domain 2